MAEWTEQELPLEWRERVKVPVERGEGHGWGRVPLGAPDPLLRDEDREENDAVGE